MKQRGEPAVADPRQVSRAVSVRAAILRLPIVSLLANLLASARFLVQGDSMEPAFAHGQALLVSRLAHTTRRGDAVVVRHPGQPDQEYLKRIVGLPGEHLRCCDGQVWVNDRFLEESYVAKPALPEDSVQEWLLGDDEYVVLGDRRDNSRDSRAFGPVRRQLIVGRPWLRYWPRSAWGRIPRHRYPSDGG